MRLYQYTDFRSQAATMADPPIELLQIKGASLNLKIGKIYVPGTKDEDLGGVFQPFTTFSLKQGATVVLKTSQKINLHANQTGILFPLNQISLKGLLMTNPGHVDPGFEGHLHVTVINMGSIPYELRSGDQVIRLMVFQLDAAVANPYGAPNDPVTGQLLNNLSHDLFDIGGRIKNEVEAQERKTKALAVALPIISSIAAVALAMYLNFSQYGERIAKLEGLYSSAAISRQLEQSKTELQLMNQKIEQLERKISVFKNVAGTKRKRKRQ